MATLKLNFVTSSSTKLWTPISTRQVLKAPRSHITLNLETVNRSNRVKLDKPIFKKVEPTRSLTLLTNNKSSRTLFGSSTVLWRPITIRGQLIAPRFYSTTAENTARQLSLNVDQGNYKLIVPLPKLQENCVFTLKGNQTVGDFIKDIMSEDPTVEGVTVYTTDGRASKSTRLEDVFSKPFTLIVQGQVFKVAPAQIGRGVGGVSHPSHVGDRFEQLKQEFLPLYLQKKELDKKAERWGTFAIWAGFGYLVTQWCFLARLTWWEFNWDIMEPITYFVTFGTAVLGYLYFAITKREYSFVDAHEAFMKGRMFKRYLSHKFPVDKYFHLQHQLKEIEPEALEIIEEELEKSPVKQGN